MFVVLLVGEARGEVGVSEVGGRPPATARYGQSVWSSRTRSVQSWRSRGSSVSLPASLAFLARLPLLARVPQLPPVSLQAGDAVQPSQAVLARLALLSQQAGLSLEQF